jgi:hypothetical protein
MDRFAVKLSGTTILVDIDKLFQEDMDKTAWTQAAVTLP